MKKCSCYEYRDSVGRPSSPLYIPSKSICNGIKEREECTCGGDQARCDFYQDIRETAINKALAEKFGEFCKKSSNVDSANTTMIYYAHHQWKYFTEIEDYELEVIKRYFPHAKIFNPSVDLMSKDCGDEDKIMEECLETVHSSDIFIFSAMDGMIGKGVYQEIIRARASNKLMLVLTQNTLTTEFYIEKTPQFHSDRLYARVLIPALRRD